MLMLTLNRTRTDGGDRIHFFAADGPVVTLVLRQCLHGVTAVFEVSGVEGCATLRLTEGEAPVPCPGVPGVIGVRDVRAGTARVGLELPDEVKAYRGSVLRRGVAQTEVA